MNSALINLKYSKEAKRALLASRPPFPWWPLAGACLIALFAVCMLAHSVACK